MITGTEMMTESTIYWLTRMTSLKQGTLSIGVGLMLLFGTIALISVLAYAMENKEKGWTWFKISIPTFILGGLLAASSIFIPTTKEMCAIKAIPMIVNNNQVQELPNKIVELANEWTDELKPNKEAK